MLWRLFRKQRQPLQSATVATRSGSAGLQIVLWMAWTFAVTVVGYYNWHADRIAHRPINTLGLVIHCVLAGLIGMVVMTVIEMHMEPWRFMDDD